MTFPFDARASFHNRIGKDVGHERDQFLACHIPSPMQSIAFPAGSEPTHCN
jgi:hypothetical protein